MSIFSGIEHVVAEGASNRQYFEPGKYTVSIDSVFLYERRLGAGKLFIVETTVQESTNLNIQAGEQRNWVQSLSLPPALPRIKSFIGAALGICPYRQIKKLNEKVTSEICNDAISAQNPLSGKKLRLECVAKTTRAGKEFIHHSWGVNHD